MGVRMGVEVLVWVWVGVGVGVEGVAEIFQCTKTEPWPASKTYKIFFFPRLTNLSKKSPSLLRLG